MSKFDLSVKNLMSIFKGMIVMCFLSAFVALFFALNAAAAVINFSNVTSPGTAYLACETVEKDATEYKVGEKITFRIEFRSGSNLVSVPKFNYSISAEDDTAKSGTVSGENGYFEVSTSMSKPGAVRIIVTPRNSDGTELKNGSTSYRMVGGACANIEDIQMVMAEPDDFDEYWDACIDELYTVFPNILNIEKDTANSDSRYDVYRVYFDSVGKKEFLSTAANGEEPNGDTYVAAKLTIDKQITPGKAKFHLEYQGAGIYTSPGISKKSGYVTLNVSAHSILIDQNDSYYTALKNGVLPENYLRREKYNNDADMSYKKYILLRDLQAVRFLKEFFGENGGGAGTVNGVDTSAWAGLWNGVDVEVGGSSQGGWQSLAVAAFDHDVTKVTANVPGMSDIYSSVYESGRDFYDSGYYHYSQKYFDGASFAKRIVCDAYVRTGLGDEQCPASIVICVYNALNCKKELKIWQCMPHGQSKTYADGTAKPSWTFSENFSVGYGDTFTFDYEIASVNGSAFELLSDGKTVKAVGMGTATVTFADSRRAPIVVETEAAIYDLIYSDETLSDDLIDGFTKSIFTRTGHTAYAGLTWADLASEISAGNIIKGRTYYVISNLDNDKSYTANEMYQLYEASGADYLVMIPSAGIDGTDVAMYAMQLSQNDFDNAYVCNNGDASDYQAGRNAGNNIVSIIEKNKPVLDVDFKMIKEGGEELETLSVLEDGESLAFAVVLNNTYNITNGVNVTVNGLDFDDDTMTVTGDSDGGSILVNSKEFIVYPDAVAYGNENGYSWFLESDGTLTVFADGAVSDTSYSWTAYASQVKNIEVSVGVTSIASGAFSGMTELKSVTLPYTLESIADNAITGAGNYVVYGYENNAPSVAFATANGATFTSLGACGNAGASLMWEYRDGVLYIVGNGTTLESGCEGYQKESTSSWYAYYNKITKVVICDSVTTIGNYAFYNMDSLISVEIPATLRTLKTGTFFAANNVKTVYIRGNEPVEGVIDLSCVTTISGGYQFDSGANSAKKLILSDDLTGELGDKFLTSNSAITELTIPAGVSNLAARSISGNSALKTLTVLGKGTTINSGALDYSASNSTKLTTIYGLSGSHAEDFAISKGIAFYDLTGDQDDGEITFNGECGEDVYFKLIENDVADTYTLYFYGTGTTIVSGNTADELNAPWAAYADKITKVVYRGSIESMGAYNLKGLTNLKSMSLEGCAFTDICTNAFAGSGISGTFEIPEEVTSIAANAFAELNGLDTVVIINSKAVIDENAFADSEISTVYGYNKSTAQTLATSIGATFKNINEYLPVASGYLYAEWNDSPTVNTKWTYDKATKTLIFESLTSDSAWNECGKAANGTDGGVAWSIFKTEIEKVVLGSGLDKVTNEAFSGHTALKVVEIPASVGQIDNYAFNNCPNLDTIYITGYVPVKGVADLHGISNLDSRTNVFVGCAFETVVFNSKEDAINAGCFKNTAVKTVIGNSATTETLAAAIGASVVTGYSENGMLWTVEGDTLTVYAPTTPTAIASFANYADTVTKIVFESESTLKTLNTGVFDGFTGLKEVLFKCDAPENASPACFGTGNVTVYFAKGIESFTTPNWNGYTCLEEGSALGVVASGLCKEGGYFWSLDDLGTLTISGEGNGVLSFTKVPDWNTLGNIAWSDYLNDIKKVVIEEETKITKIVSYGLSNMKNCTTIIIPTTLTDLGEWNVLCTMHNLDTIAVQGNEVIPGVIDLRNVTKLNSQLFEGSFKYTKPIIYISANPQITINKWAGGCEELTVVTYPTSTTATLIRNLAEQQAGSSASTYLPKKITLKYFTEEQDATLVRNGSQTASSVAFNWSFDDATGTLTFTSPVPAKDWNELCFNSKDYAKPFLNWMAIWKDAIIHVDVASSFSKVQINGNISSPFKNCVNLVSFKFSVNSSLEFQFNGSGGLFEGCTSLTTFGLKTSFSQGVIDLSGISQYSGGGANKSMFKGCTSITAVKFRSSAPAAGSGVTNHTWITNSMFSGCTSLRTIEIPAWVTKIDANAFAGCTSLTNVTLNGLPEIVSSSVFPDNEGQALYIYCPDKATADAVNALGFTYTKAVFIDLDNLDSAITMEGYAVRLKSYNGLRGLFTFDKSVMGANGNAGFSLVEYGAILASKENYEKYGVELTASGDDYVTPYKAIIKKAVFKGEEQVGNILSSDDDFVKFAATAVNFTDNYTSDIYFCGYEIWEDAEGNDYIFYTDCDDDNYDFTNIYEISLNMYKYGIVNGQNDDGVVWNVLSTAGAVTLVKGTDYTLTDGITDLDGNAFGETFTFRDVIAATQASSTSTKLLTFGKGDVTITLLHDPEGGYVAVYRPIGENGSVPGVAVTAYNGGRGNQLHSNFGSNYTHSGTSYNVASARPNPTVSSDVYKNIHTVIMDYGITSIGQGAFTNNAYTKTYIYPTTLEKLSSHTFYSSSGINTMFMADPENPSDFEVGLVDLSRIPTVGTGYLFTYGQSIIKLHLPANLTLIDTSFLSMGSKLSSAITKVWCGDNEEPENGVIDLSGSAITAIKGNAFKGALSISTLILPDSCTSVDSTAFNNKNNVIMTSFKTIRQAVKVDAIATYWGTQVSYTDLTGKAH